MDDQPEYRYYKRCETAESVPWVVWRSPGRLPIFERWTGEEWVDDPDLFYKLQNEVDYWDATEEEALAALPVINARMRARAAELVQEAHMKEEQVRIERQKELEELALKRSEGIDLEALERSPFPALHQAAIVMHEMFLTFSVAGFTDDQAVALVVKIMFGQTGSDPKAA
jgi:hypothetical protein